MSDSSGDPPDDDVDQASVAGLFDPDLIRDMMDEAIAAVVQEQGQLNEAWDELEARELVMGLQMRRMEAKASWLGLTLEDWSDNLAANDNG